MARANSHLSNLEVLVDQLHPHGYTIEKESDADKRENRFVLRIHDPERFTQVSLVIGDTVHNLRSALDHFVTAAAHYRGGDPTQCWFPMWDVRHLRDSEMMAKSILPKFSKANESLQQAILSLEPWIEGTEEWFWVLSEMDYIDKHRFLVTTALRMAEIEEEITAPHHVWGVVFDPPELAEMFAPTGTRTMRWTVSPDAKGLLDGSVLCTVPWLPEPMQGQIKIEHNLTFDEPWPVAGKEVVPTLRNLFDSATYLIDALTPLA